MCGCADDCKGNEACGCAGKAGRSQAASLTTINEQIILLSSKVLGLRLYSVAAIGLKNAWTEGSLEIARDHITSEQREIQKALDTIGRQLTNTCIEMRVALGGTREE